MITKVVNIIQLEKNSRAETADRIICESSLSVFVNGAFLRDLTCTLHDIPALVTGLLFTEGLVTQKDDYNIKVDGSICRVTLINRKAESGRKLPGDLAALVRKTLELTKPEKMFMLPESGFLCIPEHILSLMKTFNQLPSVYHETGGVHMAAFARTEILVWADDISRKNAVDKVIGKVVGSHLDTTDSILISSGRISSDMVMRALIMKIPLIVSVSAPMDKALVLAETYGVTVCGFVRGERLNIYTGKERLGF